MECFTSILRLAAFDGTKPCIQGSRNTKHGESKSNSDRAGTFR